MDEHGDMAIDVELGEGVHPDWGARILREREHRGWSQGEAVAELRRVVREQRKVVLPDDDSLLRSWRRWESGRGVRKDYQGYLALLFGTVAGALFPPGRRLDLVTDGSVAELLQQLQASQVDGASLEAVALTVDKLCSEYPYMPAEQLLLEARAWLARLVEMIRTPMTLGQRREVQVLAGWLALLVACLQYDLGDAAAAQLTRGHARSLGAEAEHASIQGWAHEISAWVALTSGNFRGVLTAVEGGMAVAGREGVAVQLAAQAAKAHARMGDGDAAAVMLERGRRQLDGMEYPTNLAHHFVVDPGKFDFYQMDVRRLSSDDAAAEHLAREVLEAGRTWDGTERTVMRNSEARLTLGIVAAHRGDVEGAVHWGLEAIAPARRSLPHLAMTARELISAIDDVAPGHRLVVEYRERLTEVIAHG
jgi:hypothetical protein